MRVGRFASLFEAGRHLSGRWIPLLVGGVLLIAAALKAYSLFTDRVSGPGPLQSSSFQILLIEAELACGLALWLGLWPRLTRWTVMLLFASFFGVALSQAMGGARSCACFGRVEVHPWLAVLLDAAIVVTLFCWQGAGKVGEERILLRPVVATVSFGAVLIFPLAILAFGRPAGYPWVHVSPEHIDVGTLEQGSYRTIVLHLRNPHEDPVAIDTMESTCPCIETDGVRCVVEPGAEKRIGVNLDLAREPEFVGRLEIGLRGVTTAGDTAFTARVAIEVVRH